MNEGDRFRAHWQRSGQNKTVFTISELSKHLRLHPMTTYRLLRQRKVINPATGMMPGRVPRIDLRLFLAEYGMRWR